MHQYMDEFYLHTALKFKILMFASFNRIKQLQCILLLLIFKKLAIKTVFGYFRNIKKQVVLKKIFLYNPKKNYKYMQ